VGQLPERHVKATPNTSPVSHSAHGALLISLIFSGTLLRRLEAVLAALAAREAFRVAVGPYDNTWLPAKGALWKAAILGRD
jgi:hypothetical protein